jgi:hypothetical protein
VIDDAEAKRWAAQIKPYAGLRKHADGGEVAECRIRYAADLEQLELLRDDLKEQLGLTLS